MLTNERTITKINLRDQLASWTPLILLVVAFAIYPYVWRSAPILQPDSPGYQAVARDLQDGKIDQMRLPFRTPGYPTLILLTGSVDIPTRALFLVSLLLYLISIYLLVSILREMQLPYWTQVVLCILLLLPSSVEPTAYVMTEALTSFVLVAAFWLIQKQQSNIWLGLAAGAVIGVLALVRPTFQLLGLVLAIYLIVYSNKNRGLSLLIASTLLIGGYSAYNWWKFDYFGLTPGLGIHLSSKTAHFVERLPDGPVRKLLLEARDRALINSEDHTGMMYIWGVDQQKLSEVTGLRDAELAKFMLGINIQLIRSAPLRYLIDAGPAFWTYWFPAADTLSTGGSRKIEALWLLVQFAWIGVFWLQLVAVCGSALTGGLKTLPKRVKLLYVLGNVIIFYTMVVSCFIEVGGSRYRWPTDGIILLITFVGIHMWRHESRVRTLITSNET